MALSSVVSVRAHFEQGSNVTSILTEHVELVVAETLVSMRTSRV